MLFNDEDKRIEAMKRVVKDLNGLISSCGDKESSICIPTYIATELFRVVKRVSGIEDPYLKLKIEVNRKALNIYREAREIISRLGRFRDRLLMAIKFSLIGNMLDIGVIDYNPPNVEELLKKASELNVYGDIYKALELIEDSKNIAMILDNAGEAVLDKLVGEVLKNENKNVVAIIKGGAFQNDISVNDASYAELEKSFTKVVDTGLDASSIFFEYVRKELLNVIEESDVIISKGMANYEYLTEVEGLIKKPIIYMLVAKCRPVSIHSGAPLGKPAIIIHNVGKT
jgi:uncharacterized protein with ATP-grasp and redox domains